MAVVSLARGRGVALPPAPRSGPERRPDRSRRFAVWVPFATVAVLNSPQTPVGMVPGAGLAQPASKRPRRHRPCVWAPFATVSVLDSAQTRAPVIPGVVRSGVGSPVAWPVYRRTDGRPAYVVSPSTTTEHRGAHE